MAKLYKKEPWWLKVVLLPMNLVWFIYGLAKGSVLVIKLVKSGVEPGSDEWAERVKQTVDEIKTSD